MGGSSSAQPIKKKAAATSAIQQRQVQPFMRGQQGLLAQQLSAGFGAPVASNMGMLSNMYDPMKVPVVNGAVDIAALKKKL